MINGVVVPDAGQSLPEGARIAMSPIKGATRKRASRQVKKRAGKKSGGMNALAGIWKNRPDFKGKSSTQIVAELRRRGRARG